MLKTIPSVVAKYYNSKTRVSLKVRV